MAIDKGFTKNYRPRAIYYLSSLVISAGIFTYLFSTVTVSEVVAILNGISLSWIFLFLLFSFSMSLLRTWRYKLVLNAVGHDPDKIPLFLITLVRNFFSDLLPARLGTLIYIYLVQNRLGIPFGPAASSFAYAFIFDMVSLALLLMMAVVIQGASIISPMIMVGGAVLLGAGSIGVLLLLPLLLRMVARICLNLSLLSQKIRKRIHSAITEAEQNIVLTQEQGIYWKVLALSLGVRSCKYLSLYVLLLALVLPIGFEVQSFPLPKVFLGLSSAEIAASLPISGIAGFGAYEGAWSLVFQLLGYSERIAILTGISHHLISQVYGYSLGAIALLMLLLPMFKKFSPAKPLEKKMLDRLFWPRLAIFTGIILISAILLYPGGELTGQVNVSDIQNNSSGASPSLQKNHLAMISGKVVFQRPDGIYVLKLNEKNPRRIVNFGSYPRWSPNGESIVFVRGNDILLTGSDGKKVKKLAEAKKARAVCFFPDGKSVLFTDGNEVKKVELDNLNVSTFLRNNEFLEIDVSANGVRLAASVRTALGFEVRVFDLNSGEVRTVSRGCSASLSPDGNLITVNGRKHRNLFFYGWNHLNRKGFITAPPGQKFDNQFWANNMEWIASTSEGASKNIFLHYVPGNIAYRVTSSNDCDRSDLFVN